MLSHSVVQIPRLALSFSPGKDLRHFALAPTLKSVTAAISPERALRANILDVQRQIRTLPKPVIAMVAGYAIGGGHVLHVVCDITIAAENARFGQTGPKVGSFDAGLGSSYLARIVGQKKAREIWYLCRQYDAAQALEMGLVNKVVPLADLERETLEWAREILQHSPLAIRCLKAALNADCDGQIGLMDLAALPPFCTTCLKRPKKGNRRSSSGVLPISANFRVCLRAPPQQPLWVSFRHWGLHTLLSALSPKPDMLPPVRKGPLSAKSGRSRKKPTGLCPLHVECFRPTA